MITNVGKNILSKFLIGQASSYASHIAVGCGAKPLSSGEQLSYSDPASKTSLDYEIARVPIYSRGYQNIDGVENIVFTAQLPSIDKYDITEIGVFSGGKDSTVTGLVSQPILNFNNSEKWTTHTESSSSLVLVNDDPLDSDTFDIVSLELSGNSVIVTASVPSGYPDRTLKINSRATLSGLAVDSPNVTGLVSESSVIFIGGTNAQIIISSLSSLPSESFDIGAKVYLEFDDGIFTKQYDNKALFISNDDSYFTVDGVIKAEKPRVGDHSLMIRGDSSLSYDGVNPAWHVHLTGFSLDLSKNSPEDELRLAFSVTSSSDALAETMTSAVFTIEFGNLESEITREYAVLSGSPELLDAGYYVISQQLQQLEMTSNFSWQSVNTVRISASIDGLADVQIGDDPVAVTPGYIIFDSLKIENAVSNNPLYGLTAWSPVKTTNGRAISKLPNSSSLVEFKFALDVSGFTA